MSSTHGPYAMPPAHVGGRAPDHDFVVRHVDPDELYRPLAREPPRLPFRGFGTPRYVNRPPATISAHEVARQRQEREALEARERDAGLLDRRKRYKLLEIRNLLQDLEHLRQPDWSVANGRVTIPRHKAEEERNIRSSLAFGRAYHPLPEEPGSRLPRTSSRSEGTSTTAGGRGRSRSRSCSAHPPIAWGKAHVPPNLAHMQAQRELELGDRPFILPLHVPAGRKPDRTTLPNLLRDQSRIHLHAQIYRSHTALRLEHQVKLDATRRRRILGMSA